MTTGEPGDELLELSIVAAQAAPFRCFGNVLVEPHASIEDGEPLRRRHRLRPLHADHDRPRRSLRPRGRMASREARRRVADRLGLHGLAAAWPRRACSMAEPCAGHWAYADLFGSEYPQVTFDAARHPRAGHRIRWSHHRRRRHGVAGPGPARHRPPVRAGARDPNGEGPPPRGHQEGQLPYAAMVRRIDPDDAVIVRSQEWIADNYADESPVAAMVERSGLLPRTFGRRFRAATGRRPMEYVQEIRIDEARQDPRVELTRGGRGRVQRRLPGPDLLPSVVQADDRADPGRVPPQVRDDRSVRGASASEGRADLAAG